MFKCFTDTIFLDDFKTVLDRLSEVRVMENMRIGRDGAAVLSIGRERVGVVDGKDQDSVDHLERWISDTSV